MPLSFADLKRNSRNPNSLEQLAGQLAKVKAPTQKYDNDDDRFWYPETDKAGNGLALIRFLPACAAESTEDGPGIPLVRLWDHSFKGPGGWYIEKSLTTLGQPDPVSEHNSTLWNTGNKDDQKLASSRKRRLYFISNILVIKDPLKPENNNKVKLFRYGVKIYDKLNALMNPSDQAMEMGQARENPFDLWTGRNFKMEIVTKDNGFRNYDNSVFLEAKPLSDSEDEMERIYNELYPLQPFLAPDQFKSYDELKAKFYKAIGKSPVAVPDVAAPVQGNTFDDVTEDVIDDDDADLESKANFFKELQKHSK